MTRNVHESPQFLLSYNHFLINQPLFRKQETFVTLTGEKGADTGDDSYIYIELKKALIIRLNICGASDL